MGIASASNMPGARSDAMSWRDDSGNLWLFGGLGYAGSEGFLNDIWTYNVTNDEWTWIGGSSIINQNGNYGTKGTTNPTNQPGARKDGFAIKDGNGIFWLFGGYGGDGSTNGYFNDMWKYNSSTGNWTWVSGTDQKNLIATYFTGATPSTSNYPGGRTGSVGWRDGNGNLLIFGGEGNDDNQVVGNLNDLWEFDISSKEWTWIKGSEFSDQSGSYGTLGVNQISNTPGGRRGSVNWKDNDGNYILFGGYGVDENGDEGYLNDLWMFSSVVPQWIWISGNKTINEKGEVLFRGGPGNSNDIAGARHGAVNLKDANGYPVIFGGEGLGDKTSDIGLLSDMWIYNDLENNTYYWKFLNGKATIDNKGIFSSVKYPGARTDHNTWVDKVTGNLSLFGGAGYDASGDYRRLNDVWTYDVNNDEWEWQKGDKWGDSFGDYGTLGISDADNLPPSREHAMILQTTNGNIWLFGGAGVDNTNVFSFLNDLWRYNPANSLWTWVGGTQGYNQAGNYGSIGVTSSTNIPGGRYLHSGWINENTSELWIFGGLGFDVNGFSGKLNDLWKYDGTNWTWMGGSNTEDQSGIYALQGVAAASNIPGGRYGYASWKDDSGNFWLFGGSGIDVDGNFGSLNDLWKYDILIGQWVWVTGSNKIDQNGSYGSQGIPKASNSPGARSHAVSWKDENGIFWLFGGFGYNNIGSIGSLNDLWKFDGTNWTWVSGSNSVFAAGNFGSIGIPNESNIPSGNKNASGWVDDDNDIYFFGGYGFDDNGVDGHLSALWKYEPANGYVRIKIYLEGPYDNGNMNTALNSSLPNLQPFDISKHTGNELVESDFFTNHPDIVDWVIVELRTNGVDNKPSVKIASRAAFVKSDGTIVDIDGESDVVFNSITPGEYHIAVHQRNHLSVVSSGDITVGGNNEPSP